jgi:hypothetical protein
MLTKHKKVQEGLQALPDRFISVKYRFFNPSVVIELSGHQSQVVTYLTLRSLAWERRDPCRLPLEMAALLVHDMSYANRDR